MGLTSDDQHERWRTTRSVMEGYLKGFGHTSMIEMGWESQHKASKRGSQVTYILEIDKRIADATSVSDPRSGTNRLYKHTCNCWRSLSRISTRELMEATVTYRCEDT